MSATPKALPRAVRMLTSGGLLLGWLAAVALLVGCKEEVKRRKTRGAPGAKNEASSNLKKVGTPSPELHSSAPGKKKKKKVKKSGRSRRGRGLELPKPDEFAERDFVENEQESRDPFRNYLIKQQQKTSQEIIAPGDVVYLKDYPIAELKVTGIVGQRRRHAMIRDPRTGRTTILKTRDRIAKERALIFEINRDHLVLLIPRIRPGKKQLNERATMYVDDARKIVDIGRDTLRPDESGIRFSWSRKGRRKSKPKEP